MHLYTNIYIYIYVRVGLYSSSLLELAAHEDEGVCLSTYLSIYIYICIHIYVRVGGGSTAAAAALVLQHMKTRAYIYIYGWGEYSSRSLLGLAAHEDEGNEQKHADLQRDCV
jgi:hypothetical protein